MAGYAEPHHSQLWLVDAFFRLHRRRGYTEAGPMPLSVVEIVGLSDKILFLQGDLRNLYIQVIEATDALVLDYLYAKNSAKLEEMKNQSKAKNRSR